MKACNANEELMNGLAKEEDKKLKKIKDMAIDPKKMIVKVLKKVDPEKKKKKKKGLTTKKLLQKIK
jgi:hypothetical protein